LQGAGVGASGGMIQICSTVISEGGYSPSGKPFSIGTVGSLAGNTYGISVATTGETILLALRGGGDNFYHQNIIPTEISVLTSGSNDLLIYRLRIFLDGTETITAWTNVNNNSVCQYFVGTTAGSKLTIGNSIIVSEGVVPGRGSISYSNLSNIFTELLQITSTVNNLSSVIVLTAQSLSSNAVSTFASMSWIEIY
jgi:hypothetical protein